MRRISPRRHKEHPTQISGEGIVSDGIVNSTTDREGVGVEERVECAERVEEREIVPGKSEEGEGEDGWWWWL